MFNKSKQIKKCVKLHVSKLSCLKIALSHSIVVVIWWCLKSCVSCCWLFFDSLYPCSGLVARSHHLRCRESRKLNITTLWSCSAVVAAVAVHCGTLSINFRLRKLGHFLGIWASDIATETESLNLTYSHKGKACGEMRNTWRVKMEDTVGVCLSSHCGSGDFAPLLLLLLLWIPWLRSQQQLQLKVGSRKHNSSQCLRSVKQSSCDQLRHSGHSANTSQS